MRLYDEQEDNLSVLLFVSRMHMMRQE